MKLSELDCIVYESNLCYLGYVIYTSLIYHYT